MAGLCYYGAATDAATRTDGFHQMRVADLGLGWPHWRLSSYVKRRAAYGCGISELGARPRNVRW